MKKGFLSLPLMLGLLAILVFLIFFYFGPLEGSKKLGLFGERKQQEQPAEAAGKTTPTLSATPASPEVGQPFTVNGSGFRRGEQVYVGLAGYFGLSPVTVDDQGAFSFPYGGITLPGEYTFIAMRSSHKNWVIAASLKITVVSGPSSSPVPSP